MLKRKTLAYVLTFLVCAGILVYLLIGSTGDELTLREEGMPEEIEPRDEQRRPEAEDEISRPEILDENEEIVYIRPKLHQAEEREVNDFLSEIIRFFPESQDRLREIILARLGTPYQLGCLGEGSGRDPGPVFRLDVADCTVLVLTTAALSNSSTVEEAERSIKQINYHPPRQVSYRNRLHFTTYRNLVSPYFTDITAAVGQTQTKTKTVVLNRIKDDGQRLIDIDFEEEIEISYIPAVSTSEDLLSRAPAIAGVAFLKDGDERIGLDVRHEGFLLNGSRLIHASSQKGKVVEEQLFDYLWNGEVPRFDGIILFEINLLDG